MPASSSNRIESASALVDYAKSLDCIHCGLCLQTCPTYRLTGVETSSPRGRIHLMRAVGEQRLTPDAAYAEELDFCLLCRHCESVCPAGVRFGEMMSFARSRVGSITPRSLRARIVRHLSFRRLLPSRLPLRMAGSALRFVQVLRLDALAARLGGARARSLAELPRVPPLPLRRLLPTRVPALEDERQNAVLLEGCAQAEFFSHVNRATVDSLSALGVTCHIPKDVVCCGSLHAHNGDPEGARGLARTMIASFASADGCAGEEPPIVVNSPGCGAHMRELHHLFPEGDPDRERAEAFSRRVVDFSEFVLPRLADRELEVRNLPTPATWDDPCHLCHGQGVRSEPRAILRSIAGIDMVPMHDSESCCGSAGIYSILRPADSTAVFESKLEAFRASGARMLITANPGCQIQWAAGLKRAGETAPVVHLAELVAHALHSVPATDTESRPS